MSTTASKQSVGLPKACITEVVETGARLAKMKEWQVFYSHTLPPSKLWVPENLESELFVDIMHDIQDTVVE